MQLRKVASPRIRGSDDTKTFTSFASTQLDRSGRKHLDVSSDISFTIAVTLAIANDQFLKDRYPGFLTGKLSDFAGLFIVGMLLVAAFGRRPGAALAAGGFIALKAMPGVAEMVAPILGGVTRRDLTDLSAVVVLLPLAVRSDRRFARPAASSQSPNRWLSAVVVIVAVGATTATSCEYGLPAVVSVVGRDADLYASVRVSYAGERFIEYLSQDGGRTWFRFGEPRTGTELVKYAEACSSREPRTCWQVIPGQGVNRCEPGGTCDRVYQFSEEQRRRMRLVARCDAYFDDDFLSVAVVMRGDRPVPVIAMGSQGILVEDERGTWTRLGLAGAEPLSLAGPPTWTRKLLFAPAVLLLWGILSLVVAPRKGLRVRGWWLGSALSTVGAAIMLSISLVVVAARDDGRWPGVVLLVLSVTSMAISIAIRWLRRRKVA